MNGDSAGEFGTYGHRVISYNDNMFVRPSMQLCPFWTMPARGTERDRLV